LNHTDTKLEIGIDDTDSLKGGCTTFVAYKALKNAIEKFRLQADDYPYLVRLNPNYPPKTKGNGAVKMSFRLRVDVDPAAITEMVVDTAKEHSQVRERGTEPAIAVALGGPRKESLAELYRAALVEVVPPDRAIELAREIGVELLFLKESKKGAVGALAALGADLSRDHTYELLAYRDRRFWGKSRRVDKDSVITMDRETSPLTFNNYDYRNNRVLLTPHGPDPVLVGIRGELPEVLLHAISMLKFNEPVAGWAIYKTNQGTDAHFDAHRAVDATNVAPYSVACVSGTVSQEPETLRGGHVLFCVKGESGEMEVICFAPSGALTKIARGLEVGDRVSVCGGTRSRGRTVCLNLERLDVVGVVARTVTKPPTCSDCGKRCKSKGLRQGYVCPKCGRLIRNPELVKIERRVGPGRYLPDPGSMRHLGKPLCRLGLEKKEHRPAPLVEGWIK